MFVSIFQWSNICRNHVRKFCNFDGSLISTATRVITYQPYCNLLTEQSERQWIYICKSLYRYRYRYRCRFCLYFFTSWSGRHITQGYETSLQGRLVELKSELGDNLDRSVIQATRVLLSMVSWRGNCSNIMQSANSPIWKRTNLHMKKHVHRQMLIFFLLFTTWSGTHKVMWVP